MEGVLILRKQELELSPASVSHGTEPTQRAKEHSRLKFDIPRLTSSRNNSAATRGNSETFRFVLVVVVVLVVSVVVKVLIVEIGLESKRRPETKVNKGVAPSYESR